MRLLAIFLLLGAGAATADTFLIKSTNGGRTWTDIDPGPPHHTLHWLRVDPSNAILYALTQASSAEWHLVVSTDGGRSWQSRQNFPPSVYFIVAAGPSDSGALYLAYEVGAPEERSVMIARVTNGGERMEQYPAEGLVLFEDPIRSFLGFLTGLAADPIAPSRLYALVSRERFMDDDIFANFYALWKSDDSGRHWTLLEPPLTPDCTYPEMRIDPSDSSVYLLCGVDFLKSADGGDTWTTKAGPEGERIWDLNVGPGRPAVLYGARLGEVWKSSDGAESWQRSGKLPDGASLGAAHPTNSSAIFGTTRDGIIRSDNGGEAWTALTEQPFLGEISFRLLIDAGAPDVLYAISSERQQLRLHDRQTFLLNLLGERQVSPGSLVAIYGRDLAIETQVANSTPLPLELGGTSVLFNDQAAPLLFVSSNQINAQVPFGLKGPVSMKVRRTDATFDQQTVTVLPQAVVILRENSTRQSDPLLFHAIDFRRVSAESPARRGEALTLFAVGMGELEFSIPAGALPPTPPPQLSNPSCIAFFESGSARPLAATPPLWAGAAPGLVGVYQVNFQIPDSLGAGSYSASLTDRVLDDFYGDECIPGRSLDSFPLDVQ